MLKNIKCNLLNKTSITLLSRAVENFYLPVKDLSSFFRNYYDDIDILLQGCEYSTDEDGSRYLSIDEFQKSLIGEEKRLKLVIDELEFALGNLAFLKKELEGNAQSKNICNDDYSYDCCDDSDSYGFRHIDF